MSNQVILAAGEGLSAMCDEGPLTTDRVQKYLETLECVRDGLEHHVAEPTLIEFLTMVLNYERQSAENIEIDRVH